MDRDAISGWGAVVHIIEKDKVGVAYNLLIYLGKPSFKKNLFCEKVSQTGGSSRLHTSIFFQRLKMAPKTTQKNRLS